MEPQQRLFTYLLITLRDAGYTVYDGALPGEGAAYPFIYLGENQTVDEPRKQEVQGRVYQTIHVYHNNVAQRGRVSAILANIKKSCRMLEQVSHWLLSECSSQILPDNTATTPMLHGIVECGFRF